MSQECVKRGGEIQTLQNEVTLLSDKLMNESSVKYLLIQRGNQVLQIVEEMERYLDDKHNGRWRVKLPAIDDFENPIEPGYIDTTYGRDESYAGDKAEEKESEGSDSEQVEFEKQEQNEDKDDQTSRQRGLTAEPQKTPLHFLSCSK